ncbi:CRISPR-associated protein [Actinobacillus equuli]|nr:CRISPR-associated protein [Actinobacillus equuli]
MSELAKRYATNLANARWLWRNRISAETIQVSIKVADDVVVFEMPNNCRLTVLNKRMKNFKNCKLY